MDSDKTRMKLERELTAAYLCKQIEVSMNAVAQLEENAKKYYSQIAEIQREYNMGEDFIQKEQKRKLAILELDKARVQGIIVAKFRDPLNDML